MIEIAVIIPCYNEELTILKAIDDIHNVLPQARICVFDNNSSDNSKQLVKDKISQISTQNSDCYLSLHSVFMQGKGAVMANAFALIDAKIYVMIDADLQYSTAILPEALLFFNDNNLDMLNIARVPVDTLVHRKFHGFGNKAFSTFARLLFGKSFDDLFSGYRILSYPFVKTFPAQSQGFEIETELSIFALQTRLRIDEINAPYTARIDGSFSKLHTFKDGFKILSMMFRLLFTERPLLVFGVLSMLCFICALILGVPIVNEFILTQKVPRFPSAFICVGFGVVGVVLGIAGLLSYLITCNTKEMRRVAYLANRTKVILGGGKIVQCLKIYLKIFLSQLVESLCLRCFRLRY